MQGCKYLKVGCDVKMGLTKDKSSNHVIRWMKPDRADKRVAARA